MNTATPRDAALWATLPSDALTALSSSWSTFEPFYTELTHRSLSAESIEEWMLDWSKLLDLLREVDARLSVAKDLDTTDTAAEKRFLQFQETVGIPSDTQDQILRERLLATGLTPKTTPCHWCAPDLKQRFFVRKICRSA